MTDTQSLLPQGVTDLDQLLVLLHRVATEWTHADSGLKRAWGRHLMDDWRSLEILAEKER